MRQLLCIFFVLVFLIDIFSAPSVKAQEVFGTEFSTLSPVPTVAEAILSPPLVSTPTSVAVPTPQTLHVGIDIPEVVTAGEEVTLQPIITGEVGTRYRVKLMIQNGEDVVNKVWGESVQGWIPWNASWENFPMFTVGEASIKQVTRIIIPDPAVECSCRVVARIRSEKGKNQDFALGTINIIAGELFEESDEESEHILPEEAVPTKEMIVAARDLLPGTFVLLEGFVTSLPQELGKNVLYIADETSGIKVSAKGAVAKLERGSRVQVSGNIFQAFQEMYLKLNSSQDIIVLGTHSVPVPIEVPTGEIGEEHEGRFIVVNGQVSSTSGNIFYVNDGSGDIKVYIKSTTQIDKPKMRVGYYALIKGIVSQYNEDYRLLPRYQHDIVVSTQPIDSAVLGAVTVLPETGAFGHHPFIGAILVMVGIGIKYFIRRVASMYAHGAL